MDGFEDGADGCGHVWGCDVDGGIHEILEDVLFHCGAYVLDGFGGGGGGGRTSRIVMVIVIVMVILTTVAIILVLVVVVHVQLGTKLHTLPPSPNIDIPIILQGDPLGQRNLRLDGTMQIPGQPSRLIDDKQEGHHFPPLDILDIQGTRCRFQQEGFEREDGIILVEIQKRECVPDVPQSFEVGSGGVPVEGSEDEEGQELRDDFIAVEEVGVPVAFAEREDGGLDGEAFGAAGVEEEERGVEQVDDVPCFLEDVVYFSVVVGGIGIVVGATGNQVGEVGLGKCGGVFHKVHRLRRFPIGSDGCGCRYRCEVVRCVHVRGTTSAQDAARAHPVTVTVTIRIAVWFLTINNINHVVVFKDTGGNVSFFLNDGQEGWTEGTKETSGMILVEFG